MCAVFLIVGEPGSGKTALAAQLVQYARGNITAPPECPRLAKGFLHAIHFCRARDQLTLDPKIFAQSLAFQLGERSPKLKEVVLKDSVGPIINIVQQAAHLSAGASLTGMQVGHLHVGNVAPRLLFNRLVDAPLRTLLREPPESPLVVLVDGLDEAPLYETSVGIPDGCAGNR